jgi:hypothetical protein
MAWLMRWLNSYRERLHAVRIILGTANASHLQPLTKARHHPRTSALLGELNIPASGSLTEKAGTPKGVVRLAKSVQHASSQSYPTSGERLKLISNIVPATYQLCLILSAIYCTFQLTLLCADT